MERAAAHVCPRAMAKSSAIRQRGRHVRRRRDGCSATLHLAILHWISPQFWKFYKINFRADHASLAGFCYTSSELGAFTIGLELSLKKAARMDACMLACRVGMEPVLVHHLTISEVGLNQLLCRKIPKKVVSALKSLAFLDADLRMHNK